MVQGKVMSWESDGAAPAFGAASQPGIPTMLRGLVKDEANGQTLFRSAFAPATLKDQALHKHHLRSSNLYDPSRA
eukprot:3409747-Pyramimonas_sp.AAC.1